MSIGDWDRHDLGQYEPMKSMDGPTMIFTIRRVTIQDGRTFSEEALDGIIEGIRIWIGTRLMKSWDANGEPPVSMDITVTVENAVKATDEGHRKRRAK